MKNRHVVAVACTKYNLSILPGVWTPYPLYSRVGYQLILVFICRFIFLECEVRSSWWPYFLKVILVAYINHIQYCGVAFQVCISEALICGVA